MGDEEVTFIEPITEEESERTDTHLLIVCNHTTGERRSIVGASEEDCDEEVSSVLEKWSDDETEVLIEDR